MEYIPQTIIVAIDPTFGQGSSIEVEGFVAAGTGIGYYIDKKSDEPRVLYTLNDVPVYQEEDGDRYCSTHLLSGMSLHYWFYSEEHVRQYIETVSALFDWNLPVEELQQLPGWATIREQCEVIAVAIAGSAYE